MGSWNENDICFQEIVKCFDSLGTLGIRNRIVLDW